ncbi:MAG: hypothetical protein AB1847_05290 [bacterium]
MEGVPESSSVVEEILGVEKNAGRALEEAKEKAIQMILQAKSASRRQIDKTREDLQKKRETLEHRLHAEGEAEVTRIIIEKEQAIQRIKEKADQRRELVMKELREILFGDLEC